MFESAELGHTIDKERYDKEEPELRHALLTAQYELVKQKKFPVIILIGGVDGAGKGDTLNLINEWMDPRHVQTNAMRPVGDELYGRPPMYRFWRVLPPKGRIGVFVGSWYSQPFIKRVYGEIKPAKLTAEIDQILRFEQMLTDEGTLLLKFWLHLSKKGQKKRFEKLSRKKHTKWRVTDTDWKHLAMYDKFQEVAQHMLRETSTADAPWMVVEGGDERYRNLTIGTTILEALKKRLEDPSPKPVRASRAPARVHSIDGVSVLDKLDLDSRIDKPAYEDELNAQQSRLNTLTRHKRFDKLGVVCAFEGCDAAGKGGAIRRVTQALDAKKYDVIPIAAPTEEERARPYLWRFWRQMPERGRITVFDRTWYGRVLVERIEGFCAEADWMRAYSEINDFEEQLVKNNTIVVKYWLQISKEEQLRRFKEREATAFKQHKITSEDWRNREKWDAYNVAVCDMIDRTSTELAPWKLVPANDKYFARLDVLRTLADSIEAAL
jgi:polyphosphate:AMP phosphotransferase